MSNNPETDMAGKEPTNIGELFALHFLGCHRLVCEVGLKSQNLDIKMRGVALIMKMEKLCPLLSDKSTTDEALSSFIRDSGAAIMQGILLSGNGIPDDEDKDWNPLLHELLMQVEMMNMLGACAKLCLAELANNPQLPTQLSQISVAVLAEILAMTKVAARLDITAVPFSEIKASLLSEVQTVSTQQMTQFLNELPTTNPQ